MKRAVAPRAIVFDLDGTLLDSLPLVLRAIDHALEPYGTRSSMEIFARLGGPPERFLPTLVPDTADVPMLLARMESFNRENGHLIRPFTGVPQLLQALRAQGIQRAIWTGRDRASAEWLLREHALEGEFDTMVCGDDLPTHKPDPEGLREILRRLRVSEVETLLVGDADVDVLGGAACGVDTLLIRHAREIDARISGQCWHTVPSPAEAFAAVLGCLIQSGEKRG
jgi:phosphoglycolate phosphatase-like HAD superfamily hydrolase